jgi:AraC-like DNA-binding protein
MMFAAPPAWARSFRSDDLDEVRAFIARYDGDHRRHTLGRGALDYGSRVVKCGDVDLAWSHIGQRQRLNGLPRSALLHVPLARRTVYQFGRRTLEASPETALLLPAGRDFRAYTDAYDGIAIRIPADALAAELARRQGDGTPPVAWDAAAVPLRGEAGRQLGELHRALTLASGEASDGEDGTGLACRRRHAQLASALVSWAADQLLGTRPGECHGSIGMGRLRHLEEWIDGNLTNGITLARLCAVAGVGDRWLESSFKARYGQTPLRYVMSRRLALARRRLADASPGETVARIAGDAGFTHLGRFAAMYRQAYGESPSATLGSFP